jgi:hypothetical protein
VDLTPSPYQPGGTRSASHGEAACSMRSSAWRRSVLITLVVSLDCACVIGALASPRTHERVAATPLR